MPDCFQQHLSEVISELSQNRELSRPLGLKIPGPVCNLDLETFDLLSRNYKSGQYCQGVVNGFLRIKDLASPEDLQRAFRAVQKLRRTLGKHLIVTTVFPDEMEALRTVAETTSLKPAGVFEATAFLYFRATERLGQCRQPQAAATSLEPLS